MSRVHSSWNNEQIDFIEKCIIRHGHYKAWEENESIEFTIKRVSGILPFIKGVNSILHKNIDVKVWPKEQRIDFVNAAELGDYGIYAKGDVYYSKAEGNRIDSPRHRLSFTGIKKHRRWNIFDTLYFFGYALTTYYSVPSILLSCSLLRDRTWENDGYTYRGFTVCFPDSFDTHSLVQTLFFDQSGLLFRHDYTATIISRIAVGAHVTKDYIENNGFQIAQSRTVLARLWHIPTQITVLKADIGLKST